MVLLWKYSRFARSGEDSIVYNTLLPKARGPGGITEPADDTPHGRLLEAIIESLNEFYSQNLGQEISQGMLERCQSGLLLHSRTPYGYRRVKVEDGRVLRDKLEPDP